MEHSKNLGFSTAGNTYTDFHGLSQLKHQAKQDQDSALKQTSKQFESIFLQMTLKEMRKANEGFKSDLFSSDQTDFYQDMHDKQLALHLSNTGVGLADRLYSQLKALKSAHPMLTDTLPAAKNNRPAQAVSELPLPFDLSTQSPIAATKKGDILQALKTKISANKLENTVNNHLNSTPIDVSNIQDKQLKRKAGFVNALWSQAKMVSQLVGVSPKILLAQAALETGWGQKMIRHANGDNTFNLFGIKADKRWKNEAAMITTTEYRDGVRQKEKAKFRSYNSYAESFMDFIKFLQQNPRYKNALQVMDNPQQFIKEIHKAGYATDPIYSQKVLSIFNSPLLKDLT